MKRPISIRSKATVTVALACATALAFAVTQTADARPATAALSACKIVVTATPWRIRAAGGSLSGNRYTIAGKGISCTYARTWVTKFTKQQGTSAIKGPAGYKCNSFSTAASGDKLLYSGVCMHPPHNMPFFEWSPKVPQP